MSIEISRGKSTAWLAGQ